MKTYLLKENGGVDKLLLTETDIPVAKPNEVLIKVKAISINPVDVQLRAIRELQNMIMGDEKPVVLGWDIAGVVQFVGDQVTAFNVGDHVFGLINFPGQGKAYAEYVSAPESQLASIPGNIGFDEAAATSLAALIALQALQNKIQQGDRVLIHAGSGGVGHFAIQIAKDMGAYVVATSSERNKELVLHLGADEHIDYHSHNLEDVISAIDFVLDGIGGDVLLNSLKVLNKGGKIVTLRNPEIPQEVLKAAEKKDINVSFEMVHSDGEGMNTLCHMLESRVLKPHISKVFPFEKMAEAHTHIETGRTVGKVVVIV